jgi:hypothetical protein
VGLGVRGRGRGGVGRGGQAEVAKPWVARPVGVRVAPLVAGWLSAQEVESNTDLPSGKPRLKARGGEPLAAASGRAWAAGAARRRTVASAQQGAGSRTAAEHAPGAIMSVPAHARALGVSAPRAPVQQALQIPPASRLVAALRPCVPRAAPLQPRPPDRLVSGEAVKQGDLCAMLRTCPVLTLFEKSERGHHAEATICMGCRHSRAIYHQGGAQKGASPGFPAPRARRAAPHVLMMPLPRSRSSTGAGACSGRHWRQRPKKRDCGDRVPLAALLMICLLTCRANPTAR